ncbi:MAG TPA: LodA/GoxA family CTQ-dependent oxidase, partial [Kofleriaceae bacterium]|nr:LodA/GoxA family CTQ-dependent oxidase [Kofleriaceae bacterium]
DITWTCHLANKKGAWRKFRGRFRETKDLRNPGVQGGPEFSDNPDLRTSLIIDPGPRSVSGIARDPVAFTGGKFLDLDVDLGELRTDDAGRLLVLGGLGHSEMTRDGKPITTYANNDYWHDDSSDGPVTASVRLRDGRELGAESAWVIIAPPKFAPAHESLVTLYDVMQSVASDKGWLPSRSGMVEFHRDIYPILSRAANYAWVNGQAQRGHGPGTRGTFLTPQALAALSDPAAAGGAAARQAVFGRIRIPAALATSAVREQQATSYFMPQLSGDAGDCTQGNPDTFLTVLPAQYKALGAWAAGDFSIGSPFVPVPLDRIPVADQPAALERGALQPCIGGAFFPGIEMTYIATRPELYAREFRLDPGLKPGDITKYMAVPWQADFYECQFHWWPAARPDDVVPLEDYEQVISETSWNADQDNEASIPIATALANRVSWTRGLAASSPDGDNDLVRYWSELGFVVPKRAPDGETVYVETERLPLAGMDQRELFYQLMNIDDHPDCLPKARAFVDDWLRWAEQYSSAADSPHSYKYFPYSESSFKARLDEIYEDLVDDASNADPAQNPLFKTRDDMVERTRQLAPFNLTDGAWLRNIGMTGPIDDVRSLLYSVSMDEMGAGEVAHNHCNIYLDLCHSMGLYFPPLNSRELSQDPKLLDSAFTIPTFELAISQFSHSYYPELMGMTLNLEWTVVDLKPTRDLLAYFGFDPHFYVMHIGIDNAANGHGDRAVRAIRQYLDGVRTSGGDTAVQAQWRRIWNGFVAFGAAGNFGTDLANLLTNRPSLRDRVVQMIADKSEYAQRNHDQKRMGPNLLNDWFADPEAFLDALVTYGKLIPGDWANSPMRALTSFETGPMYRVFTDEERQLWADYTNSLAAASQPGGKPGPAPNPPMPSTDPARGMAAVIDLLRSQQAGQPAHQTSLLAGPDGTAHPVAWWFTQPTRAFMTALTDPANGWIVPGDAKASKFVTQLIEPSNAMGFAFEQPVPAADNATCYQLAVAWIAAGCLLPPEAPHVIKPLRLNSPLQKFLADPRGRIPGNGTVH